MPQAVTVEVRLGEDEAASSGDTRPSVSPFWLSGNDHILLPGGGTHAQRTGNPENVGSIADGRARFESDANSLLSLSAVDYDRGAAVVGSFSRQPGPY